jgi:hypothetical protein
MTIKSHVPVTVVNGNLQPDVPLDLPEGTKAVVEILVPTPSAPAARAEKVNRLLAALEAISFPSGIEKFQRDDLYDRL